MKLRKWIVCCAAAVLCLSFLAACEKNKPEEPTNADVTEETTAEDTTQPPEESQTDDQTDLAEQVYPTVEELVGVYDCYRCRITVSQQEGTTLSFEIKWGSSATESAAWEMSGEYDPETGIVEYSDCVNAVLVYAEDGTETRTVNYEDGFGRFRFQNGSLTWEDGKEQIADGMEFVLNPSAE